MPRPVSTVTDRERFDAECTFREREIKAQELAQKLKQEEFDNSQKNSRWSNPLVIAILAAAVAGASNAIVAYMGDGAQREAIKAKAEADRLLEAIKPEDEKTRAAKLEFLRKMGLVSDKELANRIDDYIVNVLSPKPVGGALPSCDNKIIKTLTLPSVPALDGSGNRVGVVGPMKLDLSQQCENGKPGPFQFVASYQFYNGSGTWRGEQDIVLTFKAEDGHELKPPVCFALDRGHCVYGGAQVRVADGYPAV